MNFDFNPETKSNEISDKTFNYSVRKCMSVGMGLVGFFCKDSGVYSSIARWVYSSLDRF